MSEIQRIIDHRGNYTSATPEVYQIHQTVTDLLKAVDVVADELRRIADGLEALEQEVRKDR